MAARDGVPGGGSEAPIGAWTQELFQHTELGLDSTCATSRALIARIQQRHAVDQLFDSTSAGGVDDKGVTGAFWPEAQLGTAALHSFTTGAAADTLLGSFQAAAGSFRTAAGSSRTAAGSFPSFPNLFSFDMVACDVMPATRHGLRAEGALCVASTAAAAAVG